MKHIIVVGANGFLGSSLVKRLINEDVHVWAIDTVFTNNVSSEKITRISNPRELMKKQQYDICYNFAWQGVNGANKANYNIQIENIKLALSFAELAKSLGCKKYLCAGTIAERAVDSLPFLATTNPNMLYGVAKRRL